MQHLVSGALHPWSSEDIDGGVESQASFQFGEAASRPHHSWGIQAVGAASASPQPDADHDDNPHRTASRCAAAKILYPKLCPRDLAMTAQLPVENKLEWMPNYHPKIPVMDTKIQKELQNCFKRDLQSLQDKPDGCLEGESRRPLLYSVIARYCSSQSSHVSRACSNCSRCAHRDSCRSPASDIVRQVQNLDPRRGRAEKIGVEPDCSQRSNQHGDELSERDNKVRLPWPLSLVATMSSPLGPWPTQNGENRLQEKCTSHNLLFKISSNPAKTFLKMSINAVSEPEKTARESFDGVQGNCDEVLTEARGNAGVARLQAALRRSLTENRQLREQLASIPTHCDTSIRTNCDTSLILSLSIDHMSALSQKTL